VKDPFEYLASVINDALNRVAPVSVIAGLTSDEVEHLEAIALMRRYGKEGVGCVFPVQAVRGADDSEEDQE
jgi:hypothetical protein